MCLFRVIFVILVIINPLYSEELSLKDQKINQEMTNETPKLPENTSEPKIDIPQKLQISATSEAVKKEKEIPNKGNPYFTLSGGLSPYQASIGMLKYFIPEWWGQLELNLSFFPATPNTDYYGLGIKYNPFVAFKIMTGYSFYSIQFFEMSLFTQIQFAFVSTTDIPFIFALGFRFVFDFIWLDLGASYSVSSTGIPSQYFKGFHPVVAVGFRF